MSLTTKSLLALALAGSLSACGGGGSVSTPTLSQFELFQQTGDINVTIDGARVVCDDFGCTVTAYGETVDGEIRIDENSNGTFIHVTGEWNGSNFSATVNEDGTYEWTFGTAQNSVGNQDHYNRTYIEARYVDGLSSYNAANKAAIVTTHAQGITGEGVDILVKDFFTGEHAAHGAHVSNIISIIAPGSVIQNEHAATDFIEIEENFDVINESFGSNTADFTAEHIQNAFNVVTFDDLQAEFDLSIELGLNNSGLYTVAAGNDAENCSELQLCSSQAVYHHYWGDTQIVVGALNDEGTAR